MHKNFLGKLMASLLNFFGTQQIKLFFRANFERWLARRIPKQTEHTLSNSNIFIYPTRFGLAYLCFVVLVFLLGTNYQNNIILLLSYLLASFFITVMFHSFYNFTQLKLRSNPKHQGYVEDTIYIPITIFSQKERFNINVQFADKSTDKSHKTIEHILPGQLSIKLGCKADKRGLMNLGRLTVYSEYSLGLFKSKTVLNFGHQILIFPKPQPLVSANFYQNNQLDDSVEAQHNKTTSPGTEDFSELRSFVQGESRARTAWKQLAKGQGHFSKHYQTSQAQRQCLKLRDMPGNDIETKLSHLSFLVSEFTTQNQSFALELYSNKSQSDMNIDFNSGIHHQQKCLTALAMYS
jgi:uncharacterized protein (DUF58 family)